MRNAIIILTLLMAMNSCATLDKNLLVGDWQAVAFLEAGQPLEADIQVVRFQFNSKKQYNFFGTLKYREAGTYDVESKYLYTVDTLNRATTEKAVEILQLTEDSLRLKMNDGGKEQLMILKKIR